MAILSNVDIERFIKEGKISIDTYNKKNIQGATIDLSLGDTFLLPDHYNGKRDSTLIRLDKKIDYKKMNQKIISIPPGHFILGTTLEKIKLPKDLCARVDGKSGIGRKGLLVQNAGHIGPGFEGEITLELYNINHLPIEIGYGKGICQIEFHELSSPSTKAYSGKYAGQRGPKA